MLNFWWLAVSVLLPAFSPLLLGGAFRIFDISTRSKANVSGYKLMKDGQWCWVGVGFCSSGFWEFSEIARKDTHLIATMVWFVLIWLIVLFMASAFVAAGGPVFMRSMSKQKQAQLERYNPVMISSVWITSGAAGAYTAMHWLAVRS